MSNGQSPVGPSTPIVRRRKLAELHFKSDDDPRKRKSYPALRANIAAAGGINVPLFTTVSGEIIDGKTRCVCLIDEGHVDAPCIDLPADSSPADILRFSIGTDAVRRTLPPEELAAKATAFMELTETTQEQAARELGISPGHLSRALTSLLLPEKWREAAKALDSSKRAFIASRKDAAVIDAAMEFATTPDSRGKLPTRDQIELLVKGLEKRRGRKPKTLKGKLDGRSFQIELKDKETAATLSEWLQTVAKRIAKGADGMDAKGWSFLFP